MLVGILGNGYNTGCDKTVKSNTLTHTTIEAPSVMTLSSYALKLLHIAKSPNINTDNLKPLERLKY